MSTSVLEKKHFVEKLLSFERQQELCQRPLHQTPFYMFIEMLNEIKEKLPPKYTPPKKTIFLPKVAPYNVLSPFFSIQQNAY